MVLEQFQAQLSINHRKSNVFSIFQIQTLSHEQFGAVWMQPLPGRSRNRFECLRTARRPKSLQIDHFLNRNVHEFCAFPN